MKKITNNIRFKWMATFSIIVAVMSLVFLIGMVALHDRARENDNAANQSSAEFIRNTIDEQWKRIFVYSIQIINRTDSLHFERMGHFEADERSRANDLAVDIDKIILSNPIFEDLYLYFPRNDYIIGSKGFYSPRTYWSLLYGVNKDISLDDWRYQLFENRNLGYFTLKSGNEIALYYRLALPDPNGRMIIAKIRDYDFEKTLTWMGDSNDCFVALVDDDGTCFACSDYSEDYLNLNTRQLRDIDTDHYLYIEKESAVGPFKYVVIKELSAAYQLTNICLATAVICLVFSVVLGLLTAALFVERSSKPIEEIAAKLNDTSRPHNPNQNELAYIEDGVDRILTENRRNTTALERQQQQMIASAFLNESLKVPLSEKNMETIAAIYGFSFESELFSIVLRERAGDDYSDRILEYLNQFVAEKVWIGWVQKQDIDVFLLNYSREDADAVDAFLRDLKNISCENARIISSDPVEDLEQIRLKYIECLQSLDRVGMFNTSKPGRHLEQVRSMAAYTGFLKLLQDEDFTGATNFVHEVCESCLIDSDSIEQICRRYEIINNVVYLFGPNEQTILWEFAAEKSDSKVERCLSQILYHCAKNKNKRDQYSDVNESDLAGRIRRLIDDIYFNPLLDVRMISEEVGYSQSHIARVFKQKYDMGISQYIGTVRVMHAKDMMKNSEQNLKDIALQVGFSSDVQMIRTFKKHEQVTPGQYRDELSRES